MIELQKEGLEPKKGGVDQLLKRRIYNAVFLLGFALCLVPGLSPVDNLCVYLIGALRRGEFLRRKFLSLRRFVFVHAVPYAHRGHPSVSNLLLPGCAALCDGPAKDKVPRRLFPRAVRVPAAQRFRHAPSGEPAYSLNVIVDCALIYIILLKVLEHPQLFRKIYLCVPSGRHCFGYLRMDQ